MLLPPVPGHVAGHMTSQESIQSGPGPVPDQEEVRPYSKGLCQGRLAVEAGPVEAAVKTAQKNL